MNTATNSLPIDISIQIKNMKSYVYFRKKARIIAFLKYAGYFRCSRYGKFLISHTNELGCMPTQDMLFHLFDFDSKLRELLFQYCQIAEIQFKTYLSDAISLKLNNAEFYLDSQCYTPSRSERDKVKKQSSIRFFQTFYQNLIDDSTTLMKNKRKYPELKEYRKGGTKASQHLPCWVFFSYIELGTIVNIYAYLRGDLRGAILKYGYSRQRYHKSTTKQFDTWLEALRNLRNSCAHHNILIGKTSSIVLPESSDAHSLLSDTDLFSRIYALKKILPLHTHALLKKDLQKIIKKCKLNIITLGILPADWEARFEMIEVL